MAHRDRAICTVDALYAAQHHFHPDLVLRRHVSAVVGLAGTYCSALIDRNRIAVAVGGGVPALEHIALFLFRLGHAAQIGQGLPNVRGLRPAVGAGGKTGARLLHAEIHHIRAFRRGQHRRAHDIPFAAARFHIVPLYAIGARLAPGSVIGIGLAAHLDRLIAQPRSIRYRGGQPPLCGSGFACVHTALAQRYFFAFRRFQHKLGGRGFLCHSDVKGFRNAFPLPGADLDDQICMGHRGRAGRQAHHLGGLAVRGQFNGAFRLLRRYLPIMVLCNIHRTKRQRGSLPHVQRHGFFIPQPGVAGGHHGGRAAAVRLHHIHCGAVGNAAHRQGHYSAARAHRVRDAVGIHAQHSLVAAVPAPRIRGAGRLHRSAVFQIEAAAGQQQAQFFTGQRYALRRRALRGRLRAGRGGAARGFIVSLRR